MAESNAFRTVVREQEHVETGTTMVRVNPYQSETFEHQLWEAWNRDFFHQPVHAQLMEVERQLREHVCSLTSLVHRVDDATVQREMMRIVLTIEARAEELDEIAEHQFLAVVSKDATEKTDATRLD
jgi:hypothetical protein